MVLVVAVAPRKIVFPVSAKSAPDVVMLMPAPILSVASVSARAPSGVLEPMLPASEMAVPLPALRLSA